MYIIFLFIILKLSINININIYFWILIISILLFPINLSYHLRDLIPVVHLLPFQNTLKTLKEKKKKIVGNPHPLSLPFFPHSSSLFLLHGHRHLHVAATNSLFSSQFSPLFRLKHGSRSLHNIVVPPSFIHIISDSLTSTFSLPTSSPKNTSLPPSTTSPLSHFPHHNFFRLKKHTHSYKIGQVVQFNDWITKSHN